MTEKQIIERLILDIDCLVEDYGEVPDQFKFYEKLKLTGRYNFYPEYIKQTDRQKEEVKNLLSAELW